MNWEVKYYDRVKEGKCLKCGGELERDPVITGIPYCEKCLKEKEHGRSKDSDK